LFVFVLASSCVRRTVNNKPKQTRKQFPTPQDHTKAMLASPMLYGWYKQAWPALSARSGKRVFVYGLQSSGASTFLFLLAQLEKSVGIVDLYVGRPAPTPEGFDLSVSPYVFLKGTVNTNYTVGEQYALLLRAC
jgi:polynucleotide 5'-kinase involved in rRNA processing